MHGAELDASKDGVITMSELTDDLHRAFAIYDRNKDGVVTCDEWKAYAAELFDIGDVQRKGHLTPEDWKRITAVDKMFETVDFKYYDKNGDGKVDRAEFVDRPNRAFELADRDKNCQLTSVELTAARTRSQGSLGGTIFSLRAAARKAINRAYSAI